MAKTVKGDEVRIRRVEFLDHAGMIPLRSQTILFGPAGLGKTTYSMSLAAAVTNGSMEGIDGPRNVIVSSAEDDLEGVLVPRAKAAGADLSRLVFFEDDIGIPSGVEFIAEEARRHNAALVIVDPIGAHLDSGIDSHKEAAVRAALRPLARMAADLDLAVLTIAHPNKGNGSGLARLSGSGAFGNAARSVIVFGDDPHRPGEDRRVISHLKANYSRKSPTIAAEIEVVEIETDDRPAEQTRLRIVGVSTATADEVLTVATVSGRARSFLDDLLEDGPVSAVEVKEAAKTEGIGWHSVKEAKRAAGVQSRRRDGHWQWIKENAA